VWLKWNCTCLASGRPCLQYWRKERKERKYTRNLMSKTGGVRLDISISPKMWAQPGYNSGRLPEQPLVISSARKQNNLVKVVSTVTQSRSTKSCIPTVAPG
jgi:hypothetical protein